MLHVWQATRARLPRLLGLPARGHDNDSRNGRNVSAEQRDHSDRRTEAVEQRECEWQSPNAPINPKKHLVHGPVLQDTLLVSRAEHVPRPLTD